jgi:hypothetical protein
MDRNAHAEEDGLLAPLDWGAATGVPVGTVANPRNPDDRSRCDCATDKPAAVLVCAGPVAIRTDPMFRTRWDCTFNDAPRARLYALKSNARR